MKEQSMQNDMQFIPNTNLLLLCFRKAVISSNHHFISQKKDWRYLNYRKMGLCSGSTAKNYHPMIEEQKNTKQPGFTPIYRKVGVTQLDYSPIPNIHTLFEMIDHVVKSHPERPALGYVVVDKKTDSEGKEVETRTIQNLTFREYYDTSYKLGKAIIGKNLAYKEPNHDMKLMGIYCKNRYEWIISDLACMMMGVVTVPLYDTLGVQNLSYCLKLTEISSLFVSNETAKTLLKLQNYGNLKNLITYDKLDEETKQQLLKLRFNIIFYGDLLAEGEKYVHITNQHLKLKPDDCYTFSFTSGTTGPPKGAMISHKNVLAFIKGIKDHSDLNLDEKDVYASYLPLPHVMERCCVMGIFAFGAHVVVTCGDVLKLKDDCQVIKPTIFISVPRLYNRIVEGVKGKFLNETGIKKWLIDKGVNSKLEALHETGEYTSSFYDSVVFSKVREGFGGNVRVMASGSAPLSPESHEFMMAIMCCPLIEGYGSTQSTGGFLYSNTIDIHHGQFSEITTTAEVRLSDIPQMKYTSFDRDLEENESPRGEIWVRGPQVFLGYYKQPDMTKDTITHDGWLKTGDVAQIIPHSHSIKIIDRKKNIFKLQQGEYIAPDKVENVYCKQGLVTGELFLHGESSKNHTVLIASPQKERFLNFAQEKKIEGTYEQLCSNRLMRELVLRELNVFAKKEGLNSMQQAKNIFFQPEGFTGKNILTNTMKLIRFQAKQHYKTQIEAMYAEGDIVPADKK